MPESRSRALFSRTPDGTIVDAWIWDELLGDDPIDRDDPYTHVIRARTDLDADFEEKHPRGDAGKFAGKAGGGASEKKPREDFYGGTIEKKSGGKINVDVPFVGADTEHIAAVLGDTDPMTVVETLFGSFHGDVAVKVSTTQNDYDGTTVTFRGKDAKGNSMTRHFVRTPEGDLVVEHAFMEVTPSMRNQGFAKTVLKDSMAMYQRMGVSQINVHANLDVGGYAWAKFGFTTTSPDSLAYDIKHRVNASGMLAYHAEAVRDLVDKYRRDPKLPWHVAGLTVNGQPVGKYVMTGSDWTGQLRLDDTEAMARFDAYVNKHD